MSSPSKWNGLPLVVFGCGGAAKEIKFIIDDANASGNVTIFDFLGFIDESKEAVGRNVEGKPVVCCDDTFAEFAERFAVLGVAIPFENPAIKSRIRAQVQELNNIVFPNIIHPKALIAKSAETEIGKGITIGANAIIDPCVKINDFVFINIATTIGHDSTIGDFTTIHIGANIGGNCTIGKNCLLGSNASIKQGVTIGDGATCGMGAIVVEDVPEGATVVSGKAKRIK